MSRFRRADGASGDDPIGSGGEMPDAVDVMSTAIRTLLDDRTETDDVAAEASSPDRARRFDPVVRTAHVDTIRAQVAAGTYAIDPAAVADALLRHVLARRDAPRDAS
jgi:flagellar biosynthesis anti-sigma factor FlgM